MKNFLFSLALVAGFTAVNAQTVIWSDDFNDEDISDWTLYDEDGDGNEWLVVQIQDDQGNPVNTPVLRSFSWVNPSAVNPDNWAVSPAIDLSNYSGEVILKWEVSAADAAYSDENYSVYVATSNQVADLEASDLTFNEVVTDNGPGGSENFYEKTLDISSLAGEVVYVAFRHHDVSDEFSIEIDNVSVEASAMSVSDLNKNFSSVYPNPVVDSFNVNLSSKFNASNVTVTVTDLAGRTVKAFGAATSYNVSDLAAGVYVVKITDGKNTETKKIVKK